MKYSMSIRKSDKVLDSVDGDTEKSQKAKKPKTSHKRESIIEKSIRKAEQMNQARKVNEHIN